MIAKDKTIEHYTCHLAGRYLRVETIEANQTIDTFCGPLVLREIFSPTR